MTLVLGAPTNFHAGNVKLTVDPLVLDIFNVLLLPVAMFDVVSVRVAENPIVSTWSLLKLIAVPDIAEISCITFWTLSMLFPATSTDAVVTVPVNVGLAIGALVAIPSSVVSTLA